MREDIIFALDLRLVHPRAEQSFLLTLESILWHMAA